METLKTGRKEFIGKSLGAFGATLVGSLYLSSMEGCKSDKEEEMVKVLTPDGKLRSIPKSQLAEHDSHVSNEEARKGIAGKKFVMVIDLAKCDGCGKCTEACQKMHILPPEKEWIKVLKMQDSKESAPYWFPKTCMHCDNPPCTKVCPVDATFKREDGIVAIDNERCIGCRFCMAACPYSVRLFNWGEPEKPDFIEANNSIEHVFASKKGCVEKCDFCPHMGREGKLPACVTSCAMNAIYYGDENEDAVTNAGGETVKLSKMLEDNAAYRYLEELGTKPRVYYLPPKNRKYPVPEMDGKKEGGHEHESMSM